MKSLFFILVFIVSINLISAGFGVDNPNLPQLSKNIEVIGVDGGDGGGIIDPSDINHNELSNLGWSVAGHIIDSNVDFDGYNITNLNYINPDGETTYFGGGIQVEDNINMLGRDLNLGTLFEAGDIRISFQGLTQIGVLEWDESENTIVLRGGIGGLDLTSEFSTKDIFDITATHLTTGRVFDINADALTTGQLLDVDMDSDGLTTGKFFDFSHQAFPTANKTGDLGKIFSARFVTDGTITDDYDVLCLGRFSERLGGTYSSAGSVLRLENTAQGTLTDTSHALVILMAGAGGNAIDITGGDISSDSDIKQEDNNKHYFGTGDDASIYYNGSALIINPKEVGSGQLRVLGNVTSENLFIPQYMFAHTNATIPLTGVNEWTNITFDQEDTDIKFGISHTFDDVTNDTFMIMQDGIYEVDYDLDVEDNSGTPSDIDVAGRLVYVNGTEIIGSVFETDITKQGSETELSHDFLMVAHAGEQFKVQFVGDDADVRISTHGTFGDHPESATVVIKKVANL